MATMTLLFADQVASTDQLGRLGDSGASWIRTSLMDALVLAVDDHGGRVVDLTGDGLFAAFASAGSALDAATTMQRSVAEANRCRSWEAQVAVRIGVHTGEPLTDDRGGLFGLAVVVARRLCDAADGGQVLMSDLVRALVSPARAHPIRARGPAVLKGIDEPVEVAELAWSTGPDADASSPDATPDPSPDDPGDATPTGSVLSDRWARAVTGEGGVVVATGDPATVRAAVREVVGAARRDGAAVSDRDRPGSSATRAESHRLVDGIDDIAATVDAPLLRLLAGRELDELGVALPAVRRLQDRLGRTPSPATPTAAVGPGSPATGPPVDGSTGRDPAAADPAGRERAVLDLVTDLAARRPVLVTMPAPAADDEDSIAGLQRARRQLAAARVLIVVDAAAGLLGTTATTALAALAAETVVVGGRSEPTRGVTPGPTTTRFAGANPGPGRLELADGRTVVLSVLGTTIGRLDTADLCLPDPDVSRRHAVVRGVGPNWVLEDLESTNGTLVDGSPIRDHVLADGDRITVGSTTLHFRSG